MTHIVGVGEDGEAEHAEDLHVDEVTAIGEAGEGSKARPGEEIIDGTPVTLEENICQMCTGWFVTFVHAKMTQERAKLQASL